MARTARIERQSVPAIPTTDSVRTCLPSNYKLIYHDTRQIYFRGKDTAMWTLDDVIEYLAIYGHIAAREVPR
jgi:hypothetical protein